MIKRRDAILLAAAGFGGWLFSEVLAVPNGLLIGAGLFSLIYSRIDSDARAPRFSLEYVQIVLGLSVGLMFEPGDLSVGLPEFLALAFLVVCLAIQIAIGYAWFRSVAGWTKPDALLAAYPGAMITVMELLDRHSASPKIVLVHIMRIVVVTLAAGLLVTGSRPVAEASVPNWEIVAYVGVIGAASILMARFLERYEFPAPYLLVTFVATSIASSTGLVHDFQLPAPIETVCIVLLAVVVTCRFGEIAGSTIRNSISMGIIALAFLVAVAVLGAWLGAMVLPYTFQEIMLGLAPGAIESVAVVAIAAGVDVTFVMKMHFARLFIVQVAPVIFVRVLQRRLRS